jgi:hypothetical protein
MSKHEKEVSLDQSLVKIWDIQSMKSRLDLSTLLYLFYVFGVLAVGVFLLTF